MTRPLSRGFSLVEIMVALVIGMIGILIIMQVARTGEAQKRVTTGAGDAQNNGAMALYTIERDVKQAGYGINSLNILGCKFTRLADGALPEHVFPELAPVILNIGTDHIPDDDIRKGDDGKPLDDTLLIVYGSASAGSPEGGDTPEDDQTSGEMSFPFFVKGVFKTGEWLTAASAMPVDGCKLKLGKITDAPDTDPDKPSDSKTITVPNIGAKFSGGTLFNLGDKPRIIGYAVRKGNLTTCDYMRSDCTDIANWDVIVSGVVALRADYGHNVVERKTGTDGKEYLERKADLTWGTSVHADPPPTKQETIACDWARISALRLALVVRSSEFDKEKVTTNSEIEWGCYPDPDACNTLTLSKGIDDWEHYRYQTYESIIPLRNIPWMGLCAP